MKGPTFEIEYDKKLYIFKTLSKTLSEFESDVKSKLRLQENTQVDLEFKRNGDFFVLDDMDDLIEGMRIKVSISTKVTTNNSNSVCSICLDKEATNAIVPCGHRCLCDDCGNRTRIRICPICRSPINQLVKIFDP